MGDGRMVKSDSGSKYLLRQRSFSQMSSRKGDKLEMVDHDVLENTNLDIQKPTKIPKRRSKSKLKLRKMSKNKKKSKHCKKKIVFQHDLYRKKKALIKKYNKVYNKISHQYEKI